ncbi:protein kinase [Agromyces sp. Soil535]|uniref:protein kinase domain-containing protein n=1 Tax=Agromyces sp. Soil535 TaxID=1736390 RepID=UPI000701454F|nr:protein kinase [Agromyces sp. Soil535]KRE23017.1 hypothetical protein ASG80_09135 [Agromyces sp. Soil535]
MSTADSDDPAGLSGPEAADLGADLGAPADDGDGDLGVVAARFELGELLGVGGTASVFEATDLETGSQVAVKLLHPHLSDGPERLDAFFTEARALERLRHPGVVSLIGFGVHDAGGLEQAWIAFDLLRGRSLSNAVRVDGPLDPAEALAVAVGVLDALGAAHAAGVVHRDISPANVMLVGDEPGVGAESVRLVDFGLADETGRSAVGTDALLIGDGHTVGAVASVHFAAPEQLRGAAVTEASDLYAVAATLYFALTGSPPFPRERVPEIVRAHSTAPPPVPSAVRPGLAPSIDRIVARGMAKHPSRRYPDAAGMASAVANAIAEGEANAAPTARLDATSRLPKTVVPQNAGGAEAPTSRLPAAAVALARPGRTSTASGSGSGSSRARSGSTAAQQRPPRARGVGALLGAMAVIAVGMVLWSWAALTSGPEPLAAPPSTSVPAAVAAVEPEPEPEPERDGIEVPDVAGRSLADARVILERAGFRVGAVESENSRLPLDTTLRTSPSEREWLASGSAITIVVASGSNVVPRVGGQMSTTAAGALHDAGFEAVVEVLRADPGTTAGTVLGTRPADGSVLPLGASVVLIVAEAPATTPPSPTPTPTPTPTPSP